MSLLLLAVIHVHNWKGSEPHLILWCVVAHSDCVADRCVQAVSAQHGTQSTGVGQHSLVRRVDTTATQSTQKHNFVMSTSMAGQVPHCTTAVQLTPPHISGCCVATHAASGHGSPQLVRAGVHCTDPCHVSPLHCEVEGRSRHGDQCRLCCVPKSTVETLADECG